MDAATVASVTYPEVVLGLVSAFANVVRSVIHLGAGRLFTAILCSIDRLIDFLARLLGGNRPLAPSRHGGERAKRAKIRPQSGGRIRSDRDGLPIHRIECGTRRLPTEKDAPRLNHLFAAGVQSLNQEVASPFERALAFFFFGALQQFFFDRQPCTRDIQGER